MTVYPLIRKSSKPESAILGAGNVQLVAANTQLNVRTGAVKVNPSEETRLVVPAKRQNKRTVRRPQASRPFRMKRHKSGIRYRTRRNK